MEENQRKELIAKLAAVRKVVDEVKRAAGSPCIESYMRFVDLYCASALWQLGGLDYWEYEQKYDD